MKGSGSVETVRSDDLASLDHNFCIPSLYPTIMHDEVLTQGQVEEKIQKILELLEQAVIDNFEFGEREADAEANWKHHLSMVTLRLADSGTKEAKDIREARAMTERNADGVLGSDLYRTWLINKAAAAATARAQRAHENILNGLQTISSNIRAAS